MIRYLRHEEIDKSRWDTAIAASANALVYANSWYLDTVCPGWCALVDDSWESVFPITTGFKYGMHYIYPPYFTQQLGLFSVHGTGKELVRSFTDAIPERYRYIEMQLNSANSDPGGFEVKRRLNHLLDLSPSYETILKGYSENHARSVRRAQREGVSVNTDGRVSDVVRLFRQGRGRTIENFGDKQYALFEKLVETVRRNAAADVWVATDASGHLVAGAVFFRYNKRSTLIFSGASEQAKTVSAAHFLVDRYIHQVAGWQQVLDFEGSDNPSLARFYRSFGSVESGYLKLVRNRLPIPWRWFK